MTAKTKAKCKYCKKLFRAMSLCTIAGVTACKQCHAKANSAYVPKYYTSLNKKIKLKRTEKRQVISLY